MFKEESLDTTVFVFHTNEIILPGSTIKLINNIVAMLKYYNLNLITLLVTHELYNTKQSSSVREITRIPTP